MQEDQGTTEERGPGDGLPETAAGLAETADAIPQPSVGRIVHYYSNPEVLPIAAMVTRVHSATCVTEIGRAHV